MSVIAESYQDIASRREQLAQRRARRERRQRFEKIQRDTESELRRLRTAMKQEHQSPYASGLKMLYMKVEALHLNTRRWYLNQLKLADDMRAKGRPSKLVWDTEELAASTYERVLNSNRDLVEAFKLAFDSEK